MFKQQTLSMKHMYERKKLKSLYLQLVGLSSGFGWVPYFGGWGVKGEGQRGRGRVLAAACLQSVSHRVGGLQWLRRQFRQIGPGRGRWDRGTPLRPLHSFLDSLGAGGQSTKTSSLQLVVCLLKQPTLIHSGNTVSTAISILKFIISNPRPTHNQSLALSFSLCIDHLKEKKTHTVWVLAAISLKTFAFVVLFIYFLFIFLLVHILER